MTETNKMYFLGGGNMAEAIIRAMESVDIATEIVVVEKMAQKRAYLQQQFPSVMVVEKITMPLLAEDILWIAVKPQDVSQAVASLQLSASPLVISIAAGLSIASLSQYLGGVSRIIRIMPNTPVMVLKGMYGLYAATDISAKDKLLVENLLQASGQLIWLEKEEDLHHITAISGSGPAYVFYWMNALFEAARELGFGEDEANILVKQTFLGAVSLAQISPLSFRVLQEQVTSAKGTTAAALEVFFDYKLDSIVKEGVKACAKRSLQLASELEVSS